MSLFPSCKIEIFTNGPIRAGDVVPITVQLSASQRIAASALELDFASRAHCPANGTSATLFNLRGRVELPDGLEAGVRRQEFVVELPPHLPASVATVICRLSHTVEVRLVVPYAVDPKASFEVPVVPRPAHASVRPVVVSSSLGGDGAFDVALESSVLAVGGELRGTVAIPKPSTFDGFEIALVSTFSIGDGLERRARHAVLRVPAQRLANDGSRSFSISLANVPASFSSVDVRHGAALAVTALLPMQIDPQVFIPLTILPTGSMVEGQAGPFVIGADRYQRRAELVRAGAGLEPAPLPTLGLLRAGAVDLRIVDLQEGPERGVMTTFDFPDLRLGIVFETRNLLTFGESMDLPGALRDRYWLAIRPKQGEHPAPVSAAAAFIASLLEGLDDAAEIELDDRQLSVRWSLPPVRTDEAAVAIAVAAKARALTAGAAIAQLPSPAPAAGGRELWAAAARLHGAVFVPSGPTIHRIGFERRLATGDARAFDVAIGTSWESDGPITEVVVNLQEALLTPDQRKVLPTDADGFVRDIRDDGAQATLRRKGLTSDPLTLLPSVESFLDHVLEARGDRVMTSPYR